jgi:hypothetical protein
MSSKATVELVWTEPGPRLDAARSALLAALPAAGVAPYWDEWRADDPMRPRHLKGLKRGRGAGPHLFVNHRLAWEGAVWPDQEGLARAVARLAAQPCRPRTREPFARRLRYVLLPAAGIALVPKCPLCWAAYMGVATGFGVAPGSHAAVLTLLALALVMALGAVIARGRAVSDRRPLIPAVLGVAAVLLGRFGLGSMPLVYLGLATLAGAAVWSAWPRRTTSLSRI